MALTHFRNPAIIGLSLVILVTLAGAFSLLSGSVEISAYDLLSVINATDSSIEHSVITQIRWPRTLAALIVGGLLGYSGVLMQVLLRNPLADPYILGVSGGASVAALLCMLLGISGLLLSLAAFLGALISMLLVYGLARGHETWTPTRLLLTGVVIAAGWGAVISLLLAIGPATSLHSMLFWLMGDLSGAMPHLSIHALVLLLLVSGGIFIAPQLDILARGFQQAAVLGINVAKFRLGIYLMASLATALAVTLAGPIGFVGLVVPHMVRLVLGSQHRHLLPVSTVVGAALLTIADTLARTIIAPSQLPVGVLTAFIGVPLFLFLLYRGTGERK